VLGILYPSSPSPEGWQRSPLRAQLRELGWVEGKTIAFERRHAKGDYARLPALAAELVRLPVDVIITYSTPAAFAAKQATSTIPIVIASGVEDPAALGLVSSLARPGGNVTGSVTGGLGVGMFGKRVQLLKEVVPHLTRLDELYNPENPSQARDPAAYAPVLQMGVQVQRFAVRDAATLEHALAEIAKRKPDALLIAADPATTVAHSKSIVDFAVRHRLPTMGFARDQVEDGALMYYGLSYLVQLRQAAYYVDKILKGSKPADLPVQLASQLELLINLKTAKAIGLTIPPSVLGRADQLIE